MRHAAPLLLALFVLAGCATPAPDGGGGAVRPHVLPDLSDVAFPDIDAEGMRLVWEGYTRAHPYRHTQSPTNLRAAESIESDLRRLGWEAKTLFFQPVTGSPTETAGIRTVVGIKRGTEEPDHVVAWVTHYDTNRATVYGAYDNGSGVAVALELARLLADVETRKTLMVVFFDAEEIGLVGSDYFVRQAMQDPDTTFDVVIGHDMVGINCPGHEWRMYQMVGENYAPELVAIQEALYADPARIPPDVRDCIEILDVHDRNSDERRFKEAGVPIVRMAGGRHARDYPEYHLPGDTVEYVLDFAGGPENLEQGMRLVVLTTWWNVHAFDRMPRLLGGAE